EGKLIAQGNEVHSDAVTFLCWSPDAKQFASQSNHSYVLIRDGNGQLKLLLNHTYARSGDNNDPVHNAWLDATKIIANIRKPDGYCEDIGIWNTNDTPVLAKDVQMLNPSTIIQSVDFVRALSPAGTIMVTTPRFDPGNYVLRNSSGAKIVSANSRHKEGINDISWSTCSGLFAIAGDRDGQVSVWHADGVPHARCSVHHTVSGTVCPVNFTSVRWLAERQAFVASGQDGLVYIFNSSGVLHAALRLHRRDFISDTPDVIASCPDGTMLATAPALGNVIQLWEPSTERAAPTLQQVGPARDMTIQSTVAIVDEPTA
ncbi:MAG TPA: WD40 repeat domain-containing protein, partial [Candidatus Limnocylindria bacterium]|nr:WD40 repeat domain-containing protein [Candidatus Limnocylindria bacterium]